MPSVAEFDLIAIVRQHCAVARDDVQLGIGDDAALLAVPTGQLLAVSTDTLVAGVHFPPDTPAYDVGWKSLAVNLSDLAAMGATPAWATLALTLPTADPAWVGEFADGFAALARAFNVALVGGDTTQGPLAITVTIHGLVAPGAALLRSGAAVGDGVYVTGTLGDAAAGLALIRNEFQPAAVSAALDARSSALALIGRLNRPMPRIAQGLLLRGRANACIDVSDGLLADLGHVCVASGVGAEVESDSLPASAPLLERFDVETRRALQLAGGDDYELCFTLDEAHAASLLLDLARSDCPITRIGCIVAEPGIRIRDGDGKPVALPRTGWEHFR